MFKAVSEGLPILERVDCINIILQHCLIMTSGYIFIIIYDLTYSPVMYSMMSMMMMTMIMTMVYAIDPL